MKLGNFQLASQESVLINLVLLFLHNKVMFSIYSREFSFRKKLFTGWLPPPPLQEKNPQTNRQTNKKNRHFFHNSKLYRFEVVFNSIHYIKGAWGLDWHPCLYRGDAFEKKQQQKNPPFIWGYDLISWHNVGCKSIFTYIFYYKILGGGGRSSP